MKKIFKLFLLIIFASNFLDGQQIDTSNYGSSNKISAMQEPTDSINYYFDKAGHAANQKDYRLTLLNIQKAISFIKDKSENNRAYLVFALYHSAVYSLFQHPDEAETVLLKATGLSDADIATIVHSKYPPATKKLAMLAKRINRYPDTKTKIGPHIALAYIYYILRDSTDMKVQEGLAMKHSEIADCVIKIWGNLCAHRALKQNAYKGIQTLKEKIAKEGETKENQLELARYYCLIGQFTPAGAIADKYSSKNDKDIDFLFIKYNIEMALGNLDRMKEYEKKILAINP
jgi:hypothetical protein